MKHTIISFSLIVLVALTSAARDRLYIEDFNIAAGETLQVSVLLLNDTAYSGLQTDLYLPAGLSLDMEDDEYIIDLTSRKDNSHTVASRQLSDGAIRIYVSSLSAKEFKGNSGPIMTLSITAASDFEGQAIIELKNSICAESIGTRHVLDDEVCTVNPGFTPPQVGDVNGNGAVDISDVTALIGYLLSGDGSNIIPGNADINNNGSVDISDVTALISYLLNGSWPEPLVQEETYTVNGVSFTMVPVKSGTFTMGATSEQVDDALEWEYPSHQVTLSDYSIGQTEVTQALWVAVMGNNPSLFTTDPNRPVERVTWEDCQEFIAALNSITGKHFRLPTEAEWEYAARGGNKSQGFKFAGSNEIEEVAWYMNNSYAVGGSSPDYGTHIVGTKMANELGIYDMSGNVWEWCQDYFGNYSTEPQTNPTGPETGTNRIRRGGGWDLEMQSCRISHRSNRAPTYKYNNQGLRLAL